MSAKSLKRGAEGKTPRSAWDAATGPFVMPEEDVKDWEEGQKLAAKIEVEKELREKE